MRNARAGCVAELVDVDVKMLEGYPASLGGGLEYPPVCLVRNHPLDVFQPPAAFQDDVANDRREPFSRETEHGMAVQSYPRVEVFYPEGNLVSWNDPLREI